jgi:hypothetical protein
MGGHDVSCMHFPPAINFRVGIRTTKTKADHIVIGLDNKKSFVFVLGFEPAQPLHLSEFPVPALQNRFWHKGICFPPAERMYPGNH